MLNQIIDDVAARGDQPAPLDYVPAAICLTRRGDAAIALYRFVRQLRELDATDRAYILEMLKLELVEMPPTA